MKTLFWIILLFSGITRSFADDFKWKTQLDSIPAAGFYKIVLSPDIRCKIRSEGEDIRLFDLTHKEIPFLFVTEKKETEQTEFKPYPILENAYFAKKKQTRLVVHNPGKSIISSFVLQIRNSEIEKEITLTGSDNQKDWFIIKRNFLVMSSNNLGNTSELRIIDFPKSNYEYFEMTLSDKRKDPLQILAVGNYSSEINQGIYTQLPSPVITQTDVSKVKKSFIKVVFKDSYDIDRISLQLNGPGYFQRNCTIGTNKEVNHKTTFYSIHSFVLTSERQSLWDVRNLKSKELTIEIDNGNNEPVKIKKVEAYQLSSYLIAQLTANGKYELQFGNEKISAPNYDLKYFTDKIPKSPEMVKTGEIYPISSEPVKPTSPFFDKKILWLAIILVSGIIAWITFNITKEMKKEPKN